MRRVYALLILILFVFSLGCKAKSEEESNSKPLIITTIHPYQLLVQQMVGDAIEVRSLIPPNASPHTWTAQPADLKDMHNADLIISNGMGLENFLAQALDKVPVKHLVAADLLRDIVALDSLTQVREKLMQSHQAHADHDEHEHAEETHHHGSADPHLWTSPVMLQKLCTKLKIEMVELFPDYAPLITRNHDIIIKELGEAHETIKSERAGFKVAALVTYHNSFHYFTRDYDIHYLGWVQSSPGKEPSAKDLANLGGKIREHNVKSIFIEPQQNPKSAEVLAKEYKLELKTLDPLGSSMPVKTVAELVLANWNVMKTAFD
jgi:zinc transport system substrate-binding protein